jgi:hypothetical protein
MKAVATSRKGPAALEAGNDAVFRRQAALVMVDDHHWERN